MFFEITYKKGRKNASCKEKIKHSFFFTGGVRLKKECVLFLPGFQKERFDPAEKGAKFKQSLEEKGFRVCISSYSNGQPMQESLNVYVNQVKEEVDKIKPMRIIAHSIGGLIARKVIETSTEDLGIKTLIMLETPNLGTTLMRVRELGFPEWPSVLDMLKGSDFLRELNKDWPERQKALKTRYFQIGGNRFVRFPDIFRLPKTITIEFKDLDHSELRTDSQVIQKIIEIIS